MAGLLDFAARFGTEERCIEHLAGLRWPGGFVCSGCSGRVAWRLKARPRVYECGTCHRQESVTAGTVFHRTRTDLTKWFLAAYLMGRDKRGVSAKFLQRELAVAYQTAWTMAHKLRHGVSEDPARPLAGSSRRMRPSSAAAAIRQVPDAARPTLTRAWSSPRSRRCRRKEQEGKTRPCREASARVLRRQRPDRRAASRDGCRTRRLPQGERRGGVPSPDRRVCRLSRRRRRPRRAFEAHAGGPGRRSQCRRILPDHPYPVQQHQSLGSSALITASAPTTCRATFGNGPTGSTAATCPTGWTAISFGAPSNAPPSP